MRSLEGGGRLPLGKENILTYLLCILELHIEPAWLDHCLTSCSRRKRRWKKKRRKEKTKTVWCWRKSSVSAKASFRCWAFKRMACNEGRGQRRRKRKMHYFPFCACTPSFPQGLKRCVWSCFGNCAPGLLCRAACLSVLSLPLCCSLGWLTREFRKWTSAAFITNGTCQ